MSDSFFNLLTREIGRLLEPISYALENPKAMERLLASIGIISANEEQATLINALRAVADLKTQIDEFAARPSPSLGDIAALLDLSEKAITALRAVKANGGLTNAFKDLGRDLADFLLQNYLFLWHPLARDIAILFTLIEPGDERPRLPVVHDSQLLRDLFFLDRFRFDRIIDLLRDPAAALRAEYGNSLATVDDANAIARKLFPRLLRVLRRLDVPCRYGFNPGDEEMLGDAAPLVEHALIIYVEDILAGAAAESGIVLTLSPADRGDLGLVVSPFGTLTFTKQVRNWMLEMALTAGVDVFAYGRHGLTLLASASTAEVTGRFSGTLVAPASGPAFILGSPTGTRLEVGGAQLSAETQLSEAGQSLALSADVSSSALVIAPGDGDGFLSSLLPADGMRADFDLGLAWSSERGLTLRGSAGLDATLPIGLSIGGVTLSTVHLSLQARDASVLGEVSASLGASIGPVHALVDRVGIATAVTFPEAGGNLGVADLDFRFKPPSGAGLSVDACGVLTGGGFLFHDAAQGLYAGAMQLSLREQITLKAFGLIATRMPDGSRGYSLIVFITAEDFRPIPLGLGFTLLGIGGMVGVNRTFDQDVLRQGLKNGTLATLLFPRDPIGNAPTLIRNLASAFPARRGSYLLGILAKIGWFTPTLVLLDLALILEFGSRERLLALGRISALLPSADNDLVRLNMEAMGVIDFNAGTAAIDAVLVDSRLAHKFPITGSAALRAGFGTGPSFVLSVGGFNPRFAAPTTVPALERVAIALSSGNNPRLICEAYFAITSNTVQFGAHASLYAGAAGFSVEGAVGFDVLVQLFPLHFLAEFHAKLQLKRGSHNLFMVKLEGSFEGPRPLRVSGKATFEILWCDFSVRFDTTLVKGERPPLPPAVDVLAELTQALASPSSWSTQRSATQTHGVALRSLPPASPTAPIVLDPLGQVLVKQQVVPLNTARDIDTFGGAPVAGARRFALTAALGDTPLPGAPQRAPFAPAQFFEMSDDEKLAAPSFESMDAGCVFGDANTVFDPTQVIPAPLAYKPISITLEGAPATVTRTAAPAPYTLSATQLQAFAGSGAAARAPVRHVGRARFRNDWVEGAASFAPKRWKIMPNGEGPAATVDPALRTWSEYQGALKALNRGGARWQVVPAHEIED